MTIIKSYILPVLKYVKKITEKRGHSWAGAMGGESVTVNSGNIYLNLYFHFIFRSDV